MIGELKFRYKLWQLQQELSRTENKHRRRTAKARREKKDREEIQEIFAEQQYETQYIQDEIGHLATRHLYRTAYKYLLPQPDFDEEGMWEKSPISGRRLLTDKGITELRSAIRKERRERFEYVGMWLAGLTGLIGALTGLLSVLGN